MTTHSIARVNLVPHEKRAARARHRCITRWAGAFGATCLFVVLPGLYIGGNAALSDPSIGAQIDQVSNQLSTNQAAIPALQTQLAQLKEKQQVLELVRNRIDWRDVFARFVLASEDRVRFTAISATGGGVEGEQPIRIRVEGIAPSQTDARAFVVAIEDLKLFDQVELTRTSRREFQEQEIIEFQIVVQVGENPEPAEASP